MGELTACPGMYCGHMLLDGKYTNCTACPRGYHANSTSYKCEECLDVPTFYDWLYLGFMAMLCLILHLFFIDLTSKRRSFTRSVFATLISACLECSIAAVLTIIFAHPRWTFTVNSCHVERLSDWYTLFHNPKLWYSSTKHCSEGSQCVTTWYSETMHCTHEAVYPLYTIVFAYYAACLLLMLIIRPIVIQCTGNTQYGSKAIYAGLYFIPVLMVIHATLCGLLYFSFPYLIIVVSLWSNASHFATQINQSVKLLFLSCVTNKRNIAIILGHWLLHAYAIIALTQLKKPAINASLLALVPLPAIFYIITAPFSDPGKLMLTPADCRR